MMQIPLDQFTRQGIDAVRSGRYGTGRQFLAQALKLNSRNTLAWLWLAACTTDKGRQRECLLRVLAIEPNHPFALRDLAALDGKPVAPLPGITADPASLPSVEARPLPPVQAAATQTARVGAAPVAAPPRSATAPAFTGIAAATAARQSSHFTTPLPGASPSTAAVVAPASSDTAPGDVSRPQPEEAVVKAPLTADDAVAIATHRQATQSVGERSAVQEREDAEERGRLKEQPAGAQHQRRRRSLLIPALLIASLLIGMLARHVTGAPSRIVNVPMSAVRLYETTPAATMPATPSDVIASAPTGFLDGSSVPPMADASPALVPLWPEPFSSGGAAACAMPHDTAVLVLDERSAADGSRSFLVQHRECVGWISDTLLSPNRIDETPLTVDAADENTSK